MLQVAMAKPGAKAIDPTTGYRRAALVLGAVVAAHLLGLALLMAARDSVIVERPLETRTITALLLSPQPVPTPSPAAAAAAEPAEHAPAVAERSAPPPPATHVKQTPPPRAHTPRRTRTPTPTPTPAPTATPESAATAATESAAAAPPSPAAPIAASAIAPPAPLQPSLPASTAPKTVAHVDCTIPRPDYPDISKRRGETGTALVHFVIGLAGRVETVQLQKSSGYARLDDAALAAVHASVCRPYSENGTPVRAAYSQSFVFGLTE